MLFVDPESREGAGLETLTDKITIVPEARLVRAAAELQRFTDTPLESRVRPVPKPQDML